MTKRSELVRVKDARGIAKGMVAIAAGSAFAFFAGGAQALEGDPADGDGAIGGRVWSDLNVDGLQDVGEEGIAGVVINLELQGLNPNGTFRWDPIMTTTTASDGTYGFEDLDAGLFRIHVEKPSDQCTFSPLRAGDPSLDSDVKPDSGRSFGTSPSAADPTIFNWDAGLGCPVSMTPTVAEDDSANGRVGRTLVVDVLGNDVASEDVDSLSILSSDVPGTVMISDSNMIVISETTEEGTFSIEYMLTSTSGSMDTAIVTVELVKSHRGGCRGGRGFGFRSHHGHDRHDWFRGHHRSRHSQDSDHGLHRFIKKHYEHGSKVHHGNRSHRSRWSRWSR
ncbi:MAG: SdrD B-like domain-containing protein [Myxococcota bacterium]